MVVKIREILMVELMLGKLLLQSRLQLTTISSLSNQLHTVSKSQVPGAMFLILKKFFCMHLLTSFLVWTLLKVS